MHPLPEGTHLIHIGPQKTGSTALQATMHRTRSALAEHGVLYPGPGPRPREAAEVGLGFGRIDGEEKDGLQAWQELLEQVHAPGHLRMCLSLEAFARATDDQIERIVEELGGTRPHVVAVARAYDSLMPSQWQQRIKSRVRLSYEEWLRVVLVDGGYDDLNWRNLWVPHDTVALMERWSRVVGADNLTLIIGDDQDRTLVPRTFEQLLALPEGMLDLEAGKQNQSLSYSQVEVVRQLNIAFRKNEWSNADYHHLVRRGVIPRLLATPMPEGESRIPPLPTWAREHLVELSDRRIEGLAKLPVRIVGDLEKLRVAPSVPSVEVPPPDDTVALITAARALEGMGRGAVRRREVEQQAFERKLRAARRERSEDQPPPPDPGALTRIRGAAGRLRRD